MKEILKKLGFHLHDWGMWETCSAEFQNILMSNPRNITCQMRKCKTCNKAQVEPV